MIKAFGTGLFLLFFAQAFPQARYVHPSVLGVQAVLYNFPNSALRERRGGTDPGLSLIYLKGLKPRWDLQAGISGAFPDSTSEIRISPAPSLLLQADLSARFRFRPAEKVFQPFLMGGAGLSLHRQRLAPYLLVGPGLQWNYKEVFFVAGARYQLSPGRLLREHLQYSIGLAGVLSRPRRPQKTGFISLRSPLLLLPDRDRDGILDSLDHCPDLPGLPLLNGCPDTDGDGITDDQDFCPTVFGHEQYKGCPIPDQDRDGAPDPEDACPGLPGLARYRGCPVPDRDGDGVNDEEDQCIDVAGSRNNQGCPLIPAQVNTQIEKAAKRIFFRTGSFDLLSNSFGALDELVLILKENPNLKLTIEGHTDNAGGETSNLLLSTNRARAVVNYLQGKGVSAFRLESIGYGMQRPVMANDTEKGRAMNRRVEIRVRY